MTLARPWLIVLVSCAGLFRPATAGAGAGASPADSAQGVEFFEAKIRPVLVEHCYKCHSAQADRLKGGLRLDSREGVRRGGGSGKPAVVPGDAGGSRLIEAIRYHNEDLQMPPKAKLADQQIADLVAWVEMGAPDPRADAAPVAAPPPDPKSHWAFRRPVPREVPEVRNSTWPKNEVDRFILAKLEEKGLTPSPPADKRTLIRRATFDLTGLPPAPAEVEAFLADDSPDAFAKVVDRLLASPRYGERWGRYWLDLARYADTKGYVYSDREERFFVHAHAYRDWVIRAFNDDMPYDRFLMLQVAADQVLSEEDQARDNRDLAAMGFLTLGRRFLGVAHDIIDDRIDTLTRTTLGLTVACARCHDHKFDPVPTADYYSLYGVFANSNERYVRLGPEPERTEAYVAYERELKKRTEKLETTFAARRAEAEARFRARTGDYLLEVLNVEKLRNEIFYVIAGPDELNPLVARQWQAYLFHTSKSRDPVFAPWHALAALPKDAFAAEAPAVMRRLTSDPEWTLNPLVARALTENPPASMEDVAKAYGKLFVDAENAWKEAKKADATRAALPDANQEALRRVLYADGSPARVPPGGVNEVEVFFDEKVRVELSKLQMEIDKWNISAAGAPPYALILADSTGPPVASRVFKRGNPATRGEEVPRQFLEILTGPERKPFGKGSGRLELAQAIASPDNPLTARVMANRIWAHHFGRGLVPTPSDFGVRCEPPSHPGLLDWLALRFIEGPALSERSESKWSVKQLHRLLMLSAAYRQSSGYDHPAARAADPENRLLWRMNRQRLDFEATRDALLAVSGDLDLTMGGRPVEMFKPPSATRRSVYGLVDRQFLPGTFRVFDFANPDLHIPERPATTVPQQALYFMNSAFVAERAKALAARPEVAAATTPEERVQRLYRLVYQRPATPRQVEAGRRFVELAANEPRPEPPKPVVAAWSYGYGEYDPAAQRLNSFQPLPHFTGDAWQGGPSWPDAKLGWARLTAGGGHAGNDLRHAVVRRWTAPRDTTVSVAGTIQHGPKEGDGVRASILSSRHGQLAGYVLHARKAEARIEPVEVKAGDTIDFVVDVRGSLNNDEFTWSPTIKDLGKPPPDANGYATEWNAKKEFAGPPKVVEPLDAWAQYAQVLLLSNEFLFVD